MPDSLITAQFIKYMYTNGMTFDDVNVQSNTPKYKCWQILSLFKILKNRKSEKSKKEISEWAKNILITSGGILADS